MILSDADIYDRVTRSNMIEPFVERQIRGPSTISYGLSSAGYDCRLGTKFKVFTPIAEWEYAHEDGPRDIDPLNFNPKVLVDYTAHPDEWILLSPHGYALGHSVEYFCIPRDIACLVIGKSTYARCGLFINTTPLEPGWEGQITLELANLTDRFMRVWVNQGIAQVVFHKLSSTCEIPYGDDRKYQGQKGVVTAISH